MIGKVGEEGRPFEVGELYTFTAQIDGELFLGVNDDHLPDNTGRWTATISSPTPLGKMPQPVLAARREASPPSSDSAAFEGWFMGQQFAADGKFAQAMASFRQSADHGSADSAFEVGQLFNQGSGVQKDQQEAVKWYRIAAERGSSLGMQRLAVAYFKGLGVAADRVQALELCHKAAAAGEFAALVDLKVLDAQNEPRWKAEAIRLLIDAQPICDAARPAMSRLVTQMYASPEFTMANGGLLNLFGDLPGPPVQPGQMNAERAPATNVHGDKEIECDGHFNGLFWPFKINRISPRLSVPDTPLTATFVKGDAAYMVTRATFAQYLTVQMMRQTMAMQGLEFMMGLHDLAP